MVAGYSVNTDVIDSWTCCHHGSGMVVIHPRILPRVIYPLFMIVLALVMLMCCIRWNPYVS